VRVAGHFGGTYSTYRCAQCGEEKEFPIGASVASWSPALKRWGKCLCSLRCARAWDEEHRQNRKPYMPGERYTPEEDDTIRRMRAEGRDWNEIAEALGRSARAVRYHYTTYCR